MFYYLDAQNKPIGPLDRDAIAGLFSENKISAETQVAKVGSSDWVPYQRLMLPPVPPGSAARWRPGWSKAKDLFRYAEGVPRFRAVPFLAVLLTFAMPFFEVSCQGQKFASISGYGAALGVSIPDPSGFSAAKTVPPSTLMKFVIALGVVGAVCAAVPKFPAAFAAMVCGGAGALLTVCFGIASLSEAGRHGDGMVRISLGSGFFLCVMSYALGAIFNGITTRRPRPFQTQPRPVGPGSNEKSSDTAGSAALPPLPRLNIKWRPTKTQIACAVVAAILIAASFQAPEINDALFHQLPNPADVERHGKELVESFRSRRENFTTISVSTVQKSRSGDSVSYQVTGTLECTQPLFARAQRPDDFAQAAFAEYSKAMEGNTALPPDLRIRVPQVELPASFVKIQVPRGRQIEFAGSFEAHRSNHTWTMGRDRQVGSTASSLTGEPLQNFGNALVLESTEAREAEARANAAYDAFAEQVQNAQAVLEARVAREQEEREARLAREKEEREARQTETRKFFAEGSSFNGIIREGDTRIDEGYLVIDTNKFGGKSVTATLYHATYPENRRQLKGRVEVNLQSQVPTLFLETVSDGWTDDQRFLKSAAVFRGGRCSFSATVDGASVKGEGAGTVFELERMEQRYVPPPSRAATSRSEPVVRDTVQSSDAPAVRAAEAPRTDQPQYGGVMCKMASGESIEMFRPGNFPPGGTYIEPGQVQGLADQPAKNLWLTGTFAVLEVSGRTMRASTFNPVGNILALTGLRGKFAIYDIEFPQGVPGKFHENQIVMVDASQPLEVLSIKKMPDGRILVNTRVRQLEL